MKIKIEKLIFEGYGLGRSFVGTQDDKVKVQDDKRSVPVFVRKAVPGDELEVEIVKDKKSYKEGIIKKIIKPSKYRIEPECPYFNECGGCEHQNIGYNDQLKFKEEVFKETLQRQGVDIEPEPIIAGSESPFFYRNSIRFFFVPDDKGKIAFARHHFEYNKGYVKVKKCLLQSETCNEILQKLSAVINSTNDERATPCGSLWQLKIREGKSTGEFMVEIITSDESLPEQKGIVEALKNINGIKSVYHTVAPGKSLKRLKRRLIFGSPIIHEKIGQFTFQISPESFFQTNSLGVQTLYDKIKEFSSIEMGDSILDLFCGTGTIGIYLSTLASKVTGVEIVPEAIRDAKDNTRLNHIQNIDFLSSDAEKIFKNPQLQATNYQLLILDPPRAGLSKELIRKLSTINHKHLIYVSCNPATFARDIKEFRKYNFVLKKVQPIDMFPQTHHIECVGLLKKN